MKKYIIILAIACLTLNVMAFDYVPKEANPFGESVKKEVPVQQNEMREIKNLTEYFRYLPAEVHRNWTPYKANADYEVTVQFRVKRDGSIADTKIVNSTNSNANPSVLNAVNTGAPYQPLPASYPNKDGVKAQIILEYHAK